MLKTVCCLQTVVCRLRKERRGEAVSAGFGKEMKEFLVEKGFNI
jgi:hypothetical protein